ncbi:TetR/AcrR family transcriptional regulator [uncultured Corynebacterium sp.]|uniref:TetR/AcrR family transcriptional regulator n=1 Tax=uncultured Corynebacterium sp. TaxID=159447 RepID=UPI0025F13562|nr:TetR/AcrR family transcriptional regulator [uncultured Corynebacterium sp.]
MPKELKTRYHHGDLRAALISNAIEMLEAGENFSLRALARRAGVSPTAPYRHFDDREALETAIAVEGFRELGASLSALPSPPATVADIAEFGVIYVRFALRHPAGFKLMFGRECDDRDDERVRAAGALHDMLADAVTAVLPEADPEPLTTSGWALAHGLAFLHLDGKLDNHDPAEIDERVRSSFLAVFQPHFNPA